MTTRRVDLLIRKIREETANQDYGPNSGIGDTQICEYLNDAIHFLERGINLTHASQFQAEDFIDLVAGQEKYDLPRDFLTTGGVISVEYALGSPSSSDPQWIKLKKITSLERSTGWRSEVPSAYQVVNNQIWLKGVPSAAKDDGLRIVYIKKLNRLDIRRGKVEIATLNAGARTITALEIYTNTILDPSEYDENEAICIVDADGVIKMKDIKIDGDVVDATGVIPIRTGFTYVAGETISIGNYVVFGSNSSTHQRDLDESVEPFLVAYAAWKVMRQDSNTDSNEQVAEFKAIAENILSAYAKPSDELQLIPEVS